MRDHRTLWFWTETGRRMLGAPEASVAMPARLSPAMTAALEAGPWTAPRSELRLGTPVTPRAARHVYASAWKELRTLDFSRSLRVEPWPGVPLFLPFHRGACAVIPQGFSGRVPAEARLLSLAGRTGAAAMRGVDLWVLAALWDEELRAGMERCGLRVLSLDRIAEVFG